MQLPLTALLAAVLSSAVSLAGGVSDPELARLGLVPRPKLLALHAEADIRGPIHLSGDRTPATEWLSEALRDRFGWEVTRAPGGGSTVRLLRRPLGQGPEAYRLEVSSEGVTVIAADDAGFFRGVGRLLMLLHGCVPDARTGAVRVPALRISDWPDMPLRGMHLTMAFWPDDPTIREVVEVMARLGFNMVGYEVGGCFEYRSHPEVQVKPIRTVEQVRDLVAFAKARGLTPIPCINAIEHTDRAPQLFIVPDDDWQRRVMDLTHPDFYPHFFDLLDELVAAFDHPPYVHVGTDECLEALAKLSGMKGIPPEDLYAEFINRVTAHLTAQGVRPVVWSDMLLGQDETPGDGLATDEVPTHRARKAIGRDVIVDFWSYDVRPYTGLDILVAEGFTTWASPWRRPVAVPRLCWKAKRLGVHCVFGTTWMHPVHVADGLVMTAEYAWNAADEGRFVESHPQTAANDLFCARPAWPVGEAQPVVIGGGHAPPAEVSGALQAAGLPLRDSVTLRGVPFDLTKPASFAAGTVTRITTPAQILAAAAEGTRLFVHVGDGLVYPVDGVNQFRAQGQTIVYVAEEGRTSTGQNIWGREWTVEGGKVTRIATGTEVGGDSPIPPGGFVISAHAAGPPCGYVFLSENLREGGFVELLSFAPPAEPVQAAADLPDAAAAALLVTCWFPMEEDLAEVAIETKDGTRYPLALRGSESVPALRLPRWHYPPDQGNGWRVWTAWSDYAADRPGTLLAYEWHRPDGAAPASRLHLTVTPAGQMAGLTVLAASAW
jgi:hypothetical protein